MAPDAIFDFSARCAMTSFTDKSIDSELAVHYYTGCQQSVAVLATTANMTLDHNPT